MLRNIWSGNNIGSSMTFTFLGQDSTRNCLIWSFHQNESERKERLRKIQNSTKVVAVIQKVTLKHQKEPSAEDITLMAISIMDS